MADMNGTRISSLLRLSQRLRLGLAVWLAGCSAVPHVKPQATDATAQSMGLSGQAAPSIGADWWTAFADPQLDQVMNDALAGSPTLAAAAARIRRADAALAEQKSGLAPQIGADAS